MITMTEKGDYKKLTGYLEKSLNASKLGILDKYGEEGCAALAAATPKDTGLTAASWSYEITHKKGEAVITFKNSNVQNGVHIAVVLQYGHATPSGGWVEGRDYITPALQPIFDGIINDASRRLKDL